MEGSGWRDGWSENAVRLARFDVVCRFARFAVFAVHRGGRFLAVRFRFAVRFTAFLKVHVRGSATWHVQWLMEQMSCHGRTCKAGLAY